ncbi:MAG: hypothetical protein KAY59_11540, partial [Acidobacteria bacterium]|nr:hypothetical protein [Acidobacteriota bacterium]
GLNFVGLTRQDPRTQDASRRAFATALRRTVDAYLAMGVEVVLVTDAPLQFVEPHSAFRRTMWEADASAYLRDAAVPRVDHERLQSFANGLLAGMAAPGVTIVNLDDVYCGPVACPFVDGERSLYRDRDHLSVTGAMRTLAVFRALLSTDVSFTDHAPQPHPLAVPDVHDSVDRLVQEPSRHPF